MMSGAYWGRNLASDGIRWHELSQLVTEEFRHHARSGDDSRGYEVAGQRQNQGDLGFRVIWGAGSRVRAPAELTSGIPGVS
jgi:hypothetical protein